MHKERTRVRKLLIIREALFAQERKSPEVADNTVQSFLESGESLQMKEIVAPEGTSSETKRPSAREWAVWPTTNDRLVGTVTAKCTIYLSN